MSLSIADKQVAILAADGFNEHQMTEIQRALVKARARLKIVASETGVVNGWQGDGWGHHFHVDAPVYEALGSDFDMLVLPGGLRSADKLRQNPHTRRIINHFLDADKPVAAIGEGVSLLALGGKVSGRTVAAAAGQAEALKAAGAVIGENPEEVDGNLFTSNGDDLAAWVEGAIEFFGDADMVKRAA
ncbi:MAG: DJ-1/PfpI family protein [Bdellovibrionales bacterium]